MASSGNTWHIEETYRSLMTYGMNILKFCFLTNGAAIIALLSFVGDLATKPGHVPDMRLPVVLFIIGLLFSGIAAAFAYVTQLTLYGESRDESDFKGWSSHVRWLWLTLLFVVLSIALFATGSITAAWRLQ
jgi:hypothetical protein